MKFIIALSVLIACASAASLFDAEWTAFKAKHGKSYGTIEDNTRRAIWEKNLALVNKHNAEFAKGLHTYDLAMNKFADMTNQEFRQQYNGFNGTKNMHNKVQHTYMAPQNFEAPADVDWRTKGYVTPVKNQAQCGSCWAFSTVASLEGQHFAKTGNLVSLSEQNLVDCSQRFGNMGCNGGLMDQAFEYIKENGGIDTEESYPYTARDGTCKFSRENVGATVTGYTDIPSGDEEALTQAIASVGPISVAIDASHSSFQLYSSGVYSELACSTRLLDHGVTAVGYGTERGSDYYIVKNSWGPEWGMDGYIMMSRNENNQCGIASQASYPLV